MTCAYNEMYLSDAMDNMGEMVDVAVNDLGYELDAFMKIFLNSQVCIGFQNGNPAVLLGLSGTDMALRVLEEAGLSTSLREEQAKYLPSTEYWAGWILAYYHWKTGIMFENILEYLPASEIRSKYKTLHEVSEEKCADAFSNIIRKKIEESEYPSRLQKKRRLAGLSQSQLAEEAGINLRTLQQYEIKAKSINKAAYETVVALAKALYCEPGDILELNI